MLLYLNPIFNCSRSTFIIFKLELSVNMNNCLSYIRKSLILSPIHLSTEIILLFHKSLYKDLAFNDPIKDYFSIFHEIH